MCSRGYPTNSGTEDSEGEDNDAFEASQLPRTRTGGGSTGMKKHVELDAQGQPFGSMKAVLCGDIKKYAKDLDPTTGWEGQPRHDRKYSFGEAVEGEGGPSASAAAEATSEAGPHDQGEHRRRNCRGIGAWPRRECEVSILEVSFPSELCSFQTIFSLQTHLYVFFRMSRPT